jgi:hypothetical protein
MGNGFMQNCSQKRAAAPATAQIFTLFATT